MAQLPTTDQVLAVARELAATDWTNLARDVIDHINLERAAAPNGYPTGGHGGGGHGSDVARPTERAAVNVAGLDDETRTRHREHLDNAVAYLFGALDSARAAQNRTAKLAKLTNPTPPRASDPSACCERYCEDPADPGRGGRCEPCYRWRHRWAEARGVAMVEAPPVPKDAIADRIARRDNRKIRVSGPHAGELAS